MPHFLKLTESLPLADDPQHKGKPIWLNMDLIVSIYPEDGKTYLNEFTDDGGSWVVNETPEEILQFLKPQRVRTAQNVKVELPK